MEWLQIWHIWAIVALLCVILEIFTAGFAVICFSFGAAGAAVCAACGLSLAWQIAAFSLFTALAFVLVRPFVIKHFYSKEEVKTNADAIIGRVGRVSEKIDNHKNTGRVALDGDDWKARALNDELINIGTQVEILSRESIILTVKPVKKTEENNIN